MSKNMRYISILGAFLLLGSLALSKAKDIYAVDVAEECAICTIDDLGSCSIESEKSEWFIANLFDTSDYPARWNCGNWSSFTGWLFISADISISLAYFSIPLMLIYFARKEGASFTMILWLFAAFIFSCGVGHTLDAIMFYWPAYRLLALMHMITAVISITTAITLSLYIPRAIEYMNKSKLETDMLRNLFEYSSIGKCHVNFEGQFIKINPKLNEIVGYEPEELIGKTFHEITHPDDLEMDLELVQKMIDNKIDSYVLEKRYYHKSSNLIWVEITVSMVKDKYGNNLHFIVEIIDITQRKKHQEEIAKVEKEILRSNKELEAFAYAISHDLKAPLRAVDNLSQWVMEDVGEDLPEDAVDKLNILRERVQRMKKLIDGLLEFSRIGRAELDMQNFSSMKSIEEAIKSLYPSGGIDFDIEPLPVIYGNPIRFSQVVSNLINNGVKHNKSGSPSISIGCKDLDKDFYEFSIKDNGIGIEDQYHNKIFDMFMKLTPKDQEDGVGAGLALVKRIITQMGGNIRLESEIDRGTIFYFTWPKNPGKNKGIA